MSLLTLRSFIEVFRARSISAAARNLGLTQPAVSGHVASLEAQVGRTLFLRQARGVEPTPFAEDLALEIGDSLDQAEEALAKARVRSTHVSGVVYVTGPAELMAERVAPAIKSLQDAGLDIRVQLGGKDAIYGGFRDGKVDLAFTASTPEDPQLASQFVGSERLVAVASPAQIKKLTTAPDLASVLRAEPLLAYDTDLPLIRDWMGANGMSIQGTLPSVTAPDLRMLRALVISGAGWSVLPDYLIETAVTKGDLGVIPAPKMEPTNAFHLVWSKSALRHPRIARARDVLLESWTG